MNDLIDFIRARLDEDAAIAAGAGEDGPHWRGTNDGVFPDNGNGALVVDGYGYLSDELAEHIARHDPARVLAEVAAKRRMVENLEAVQLEQPALRELRGPLAEVTLRMLALPYAEHPDYREEWRP